MNAPLHKNKNNDLKQNSDDRKKLWPALVAAGSACGLIANPASALEIGEINVQSALGQPLRASIAYALQPYEQVSDLCIFLRSGTSAEGLQFLSQATVSVGASQIILRGTAPVREPMMALHVAVDCPYTPRMAREYTLFFDPLAVVEARGDAVELPRETEQFRREPAVRAARDGAPAANVVGNRQRRAAAAADRTPISQETTYQVQRGDSLSEIASRIENRRVGLWAAVDAIFAANPQAFIDNDRDKLKSGSILVIPDLVRAASTVAAQADGSSTTVSGSGNNQAVAPYQGIEAQPATAGATTSSGTTADATAATAPGAEVVDDTSTLLSNTGGAAADSTEVSVSETVADSADGSIELPPADQSPFVTPLDEAAPEVVIPDTQVDDAVQTAPVVVTNNEVSGEGESWNWLLWLGGLGMALILGLLFFGRRLREGASPRPSPAFNDLDLDVAPRPVSAANRAQPPAAAAAASASAAQPEREELDSFAPVENKDVTIDFDISSNELQNTETPATQVHIADTGNESTILESEITPAERSGEYAVTTPDVRADIDLTNQTGSVSLTSEVDIKMLEQDYEEEFTATQALNAEIAKAAAELAERMEADDASSETAVIPAINPDDTLDIALTAETVSISADDVPLDASVVTEEIQSLSSTMSGEIPLPADIEAQLEATSEELALSQTSQERALEETSEVAAVGQPAEFQEIEETSEIDVLAEASEAQAAAETMAVPAIDATSQVQALDETTEIPAMDATSEVQAIDETSEVQAIEETSEVQAIEETMAVQGLDETFLIESLDETEEMTLAEETVSVELMDDDEDTKIEATAQMAMPKAPRDADATAELTSQLPKMSDAVNDDFEEMDETAVLTRHEETIEAEIGDETMEVEVESGKVDTKKIKIS